MSANEVMEESTDLELMDRVGLEISTGIAGQITKSEVEAQLDAAHKYPRSIKRFLSEAITLATFNREIAASCMYAAPRSGKVIEGPSVRLAEICISAYGNLHVGARVVGAEDKEVVSQGVCWDLEKNNRITIEKRRKITDKKGNRFNDDMINVTGNAAASIALRDAAFRVIPRTYVNAVYDAARKVAVGEASTLAARRDEIVNKLVKMGAMPDRILARIGKPSFDDVGLAELQILIGFGTAIHSGAEKVDDIFPMVVVEKGKVDLNSLKPGQEENRGHGKENLDQLKPKESAAATTQPSQPGQGGGNQEKDISTRPPQAAETKSQAPADNLNEKCTQEQFDQLQLAQTENDVDAKAFILFVKQTMGYKMVAHLRQRDFDRALRFLKNGGKE